MIMISTTQELESALAPLAKEPFIAVDTEFMRESTYWPLLCVIQIAGPDKKPVLIDAMAEGLDLAPFYGLMVNEAVEKVFHAARQDVEIVFHATELIPSPMFDTQVAAAVCGFGESVGYEQIVARTTGGRIDKTHRFTDWSRRPLSDKQLAYAAADVIHLVDVYQSINAELERRGRRDWTDDEMAILTSPETYRMDPDEAWRRVKTKARKPRELALIRTLAAWREREAQRRDVPRSRVLKDDALNDIALRKPQSPEALGALRPIPRGFERSEAGRAIIALVAKVMAKPESDLPAPPPERRRKPAPPALSDLLKVLLRDIAEREGVAARLLATSEDIDRIAAEDDPDVPALKGWRRKLFGDAAIAVKNGELSLAFDDGRLALDTRS